MSSLKSSLLCMAAMAALCFASDDPGRNVRVGGPVSGILFDAQARALRPVLGVPGAAYLGDELVSGLDFASVSPGGKIAVAVKDGALFLVRGLDIGQVEMAPVAGAIESVDRAAWAGSTAAVSSSSTGLVQVLKLGSDPGAGDPAQSPAGLVALAAGESAAAFATADGAIYALAGGTPRMITQISTPGGLAVAGTDLFVTDRSRGEILRVRNFTEAGDAVLFANGLSDPVAVSVHRGRVFAASAAEHAIAAWDAATGAPAGRVEIDFEPSRMESLAGSLFLLNNGGAEPLQVLDAAEAPAVYFVPARRADLQSTTSSTLTGPSNTAALRERPAAVTTASEE